MAVSSLTCPFGTGFLTEKTARPGKGAHFLQAVVPCPFRGAPEYKKTFLSFLFFFFFSFKPLPISPQSSSLPAFSSKPRSALLSSALFGRLPLWGAFTPNTVVSGQISQSPVTSLSISVTFPFVLNILNIPRASQTS